jgi:Tfp pilus assembly protein PilX
MKIHNSRQSLSLQRGAAVLLVSIILLIGVTLITVFAARVGVMDQRIAANEYRHKEAQAAADAALEQSSAFIENNTDLYEGAVGGTSPWKDCTNVAIKDVLPCKIGSKSYDLAYDGVIATTTIEPLEYTVSLTSNIASDSYIVYEASSAGNIITAIGTGKSLDDTGEAFSQVSYGKTTFITPGVVPPVLASGVDLSGSFTIIADPRVTHNQTDCKTVTPLNVSPITNDDGDILGDLSLWVDGSGSGGTWQTCGIDSYVDSSATSAWGGPLKCVYEYTDTDDWSNCACDPDDHLSDSGAGSSAGYTPTYDHPDIKGSWNVIEDFPDSPFEHFFNGKTVAEVKAIAQSDGIYVDGPCNDSHTAGYKTNAKPIIWCTGDATFTTSGEQYNPIIAVSEGKLKLNAGANVWGIFVGLTDFTANGGAKVHGAVIVEDTDTYSFLTNGNYEQIYDFCVLSGLQDDAVNSDIAKLAYSAKDFQSN